MQARAIVVPVLACAAIFAVPAIGVACAAQTNPQPASHSPALITYHGRTFDPSNIDDVQEYNLELKTPFPSCSGEPPPTFMGTATTAITICLTSNRPGPTVLVGSPKTDGR